MSKFNEVGISRLLGEDKCDYKMENDESKEEKNFLPISSSNVCGVSSDKNSNKAEEEKKILRFTMLFNKFNSDLQMKRNRNLNDDLKYTVYFNKEVVNQNKTESVQSKNSVKCHSTKKESKEIIASSRTNAIKSKYFHKPVEPEFGKPHFSEPEMMFSESLTPAFSPIASPSTRIQESENIKKNYNKKHQKLDNNNSLIQLNVHPALRTDLRHHSSLTSLYQNNSVKGVLKSKIPSLTAIEGTAIDEKSEFLKVNQWDDWDDLLLMHDLDKRINLQISRSSNDNNRRSTIKFKKEDCASVSDSKLLYAGTEFKKQIKKCDKKSRGDSFKREREAGNRKQVQWKTEVDVIYFSTHLAANGDRTGEVIGRVMEPLREEWEQQRKGFYAKMVPYHMESHLKDRFISLLKI